MKKPSMMMSNAREKKQLERMLKLSEEKKCFFCDKNYLELGAAPSIYSSKKWYIKKNDFPYKGSVHHYLIVSKNHISNFSQIDSRGWKELFEAVTWLEKKLKINGFSIFLRSGDVRYTGATIDHLHFHLILGVKKEKHRIEDNILITLGHKKI